MVAGHPSHLIFAREVKQVVMVIATLPHSNNIYDIEFDVSVKVVD
jgi:hypothetical protein